MDKTCLEIRDLLALGADVAPNERIAIESHVSLCAECARALAEMQAMIGTLALLREGPMPAGAAERIWRGVQPAVPGARRPAILAWAARAAAILVIGLAVGYTSKSMAARTPGSGVAAEEPSLDDTRPTIVSGVRSSGATDGGGQDSAASLNPGVPMFILQAWSRHYLPSVDEILESDVVRF